MTSCPHRSPVWFEADSAAELGPLAGAHVNRDPIDLSEET
jgi:hypothetical protein